MRQDRPQRQPGEPGPRIGPTVISGPYLVRLTVEGVAFQRAIRVERDPLFPAAMRQEELEAFEGGGDEDQPVSVD